MDRPQRILPQSKRSLLRMRVLHRYDQITDAARPRTTHHHRDLFPPGPRRQRVAGAEGERSACRRVEKLSRQYVKVIRRRRVSCGGGGSDRPQPEQSVRQVWLSRSLSSALFNSFARVPGPSTASLCFIAVRLPFRARKFLVHAPGSPSIPKAKEYP